MEIQWIKLVYKKLSKHAVVRSFWPLYWYHWLYLHWVAVCNRDMLQVLALPAVLAKLDFCTTHNCSLNPLLEVSVLHLSFQLTRNLVTNYLDFMFCSSPTTWLHYCPVSKEGTSATEKFQRLLRCGNSGVFLPYCNAYLAYFSQVRRLFLICLCYSLEQCNLI